ncbi:MAG: hypothetical protein WD050_03265 [Actinomycetota bacterium]
MHAERHGLDALDAVLRMTVPPVVTAMWPTALEEEPVFGLSVRLEVGVPALANDPPDLNGDRGLSF